MRCRPKHDLIQVPRHPRVVPPRVLRITAAYDAGRVINGLGIDDDAMNRYGSSLV